MTTKRTKTGWRLDYTFAGQRRRENFPTREQADLRKLEIARARVSGETVTVPDIQVGALVERWESWLDTQTRSPAYRKRITVAKRALAPILATKLRHLSKPVLDNYVAMRKAAGRAGNTIGAEYRTLHAALEFALSREIIPRNPISHYRLEKPKERIPAVPSPEDLQRIFDHVRGTDENDRTSAWQFYWMALATGMRFSELASARADHIRNNTLTVIGKGGYQRSFAMPATPFPIPATGNILTTARGAQWKHRVLLNRLQGACVLAGLPIINLHTLRHAHATFALAQGEPLHSVMTRCGWRSFAVMQRYVSMARQWQISTYLPKPATSSTPKESDQHPTDCACYI